MSWSVTISGHDADGDPDNDNLQKMVDAAAAVANDLGLSVTTTVVNGTVQGVSIGPQSTDVTEETNRRNLESGAGSTSFERAMAEAENRPLSNREFPNGPVSEDYTAESEHRVPPYTQPSTAFQGSGQPTVDNVPPAHTEPVYTEPVYTETVDTTPNSPTKNEGIKAWIAYAVSRGESQESAESMSKQQLIDKYYANE